MSVNWLIAGLGNPGGKYDNTRHNVGFRAIDVLSEKLSIKCNKLKFQALYGTNQDIILLKPQTFMNLSGRSVRDAAAFYKLKPEQIIVIFDDVSLPLGKLRIRAKGSDGGHNGIKSVLYELQSDAFLRVKIGVGEKPRPEMDLADWVLSGFSASENTTIKETIEAAALAAKSIIDDGIDKAMNKYNN